MKKLMILAAAAAMAGTVSAAEAQVYDATLTVKTTACRNGKYTRALVNFPTTGANIFGYSVNDTVQYRKQATRKIAGVFWGCDCETIADPAWRVYTSTSSRRTTRTVGGYAFWDATRSPYIPFTIPYVSFEWLVLNRIDQMKSVEGTWLLRDRAADEALYLMGAGFGTVNNVAADECNSTIKSISGNFAGFLQYASGDDDGCVFCGVTDYFCLVAPFCWCVDVEDTTFLTSAYGTWSIKYNKTASTRLKNAPAANPYITAVSTYTGRAFTNGDPSVVAALNAMRVAVLASSIGTDSEWDEYIVLPEGKLTKKGVVIQSQKKLENGDELLKETKDPYFGELENQEDPGLATEDPFFPENAKKYLDAS